VLQIWDGLSQIRIKTFFNPRSGSENFSSQILHKKRDEKLEFRTIGTSTFFCSLWFQEQVLFVKKIIHPGSWKNVSWVRIPDPRDKKAPDPGPRSATL
jgi:hypothetical protein